MVYLKTKRYNTNKNVDKLKKLKKQRKQKKTERNKKKEDKKWKWRKIKTCSFGPF